MITTRVFQSENSQMLRIPQELRTDHKEYCINKIGDIYIAFPTDDPWAPAHQVIGVFSENFMNEREQPSWDDVQDRMDL